MIKRLDRSWVGFLFLMLLAAIGFPAKAAGVKVVLVTPTGQPGVSGLSVRLLCGAQPKAEEVWEQKPLEFNLDGCLEPTFEAGYVSVSREMGARFVSWAKQKVGNIQPGDLFTLTVPKLTRVTVRAEGPPEATAGEVWAAFMSVSDSEPNPFRWGAVLFLSTGEEASGFVEPGRFDFRVSSQTGVAVVEVDGQQKTNEYSLGRKDKTFQTPVAVGNDPLLIKVVFKPGFVASGRVVDGRGQGVPGIVVGDQEKWMGERTRPDGSFRLGFTELPVNIRAVDEDGEWTFSPEEVRLETAEQLKELLLFRGHKEERAVLELTVVDPEGNPVPEAGVWGHGQCGKKKGFHFDRKTNRGGSALIPCEPECRLSFNIKPVSNDLFWKNWEENEPTCPAKMKVALERGRSIEGRVVDEKHEPLSGFKLGGDTRHAETDADGRFHLAPFQPGDVVIANEEMIGPRADRVLVRRSPRKGERKFPIAVEIPEKGAAPFQELELVRGGFACVQVQDKDGKEIPLDAVTLFYAPNEESWAKSRYSRSAANRADPGRLCTGRVPPGTYYLRVGQLVPGIVPTWYPETEDPSGASPIEIEAGKSVELGPITVTPSGTIAALLPETVELTAEQEKELDVELKPIAPAPVPGAERTEPPQSVVHRTIRTTILIRSREQDKAKGISVLIHTVPIGMYHVRLTVPGKRPKEVIAFELPDPVTVAAGQWTSGSPRFQEVVEPPQPEQGKGEGAVK